MKTKLLFLGMLLSLNLTFGQANSNQSVIGVAPAITQPIAAFGSEIFRFRTGLVNQLDSGNGFTTDTSQWFAIGRVGGSGTSFNQTFYGLRFQQPNRALLMGYTSANPNNPLIQWGGNGLSVGNLEFRVSSSLGTVGTPANDVVVATMSKEGNTFFGTDQSALGATAKVNIRHSQALGLNIENKFIQTVSDGIGFKVSAASGISTNIGGDILTEGAALENAGLRLVTKDGKMAMGIRSIAFASTLSGLSSSFGIFGETLGLNSFEAAIYGRTPSSFGNKFAGYFDGVTFSTTGWGPSDVKLKDNVKQETGALLRLSKLRPVTYDFKKMSELNLPNEVQHGFVAQELEAVFPELTKDISKPVFDKEGKVISYFEFKSVNYTGLISVLAAGINELNEELNLLKQELADLKNNYTSASKIGSTINTKGFVLEQNIPNPYTNQTTINYQFSQDVKNGSLMVFDLNGRMIKEYPLNQNKGQLTITASEIGKGLFIYSLVQNGQELLSKKMIIN